MTALANIWLMFHIVMRRENLPLAARAITRRHSAYSEPGCSLSVLGRHLKAILSRKRNCTTCMLAAVVALLAISNAYFALVCYNAHVGMTNALGFTLMQARGPMSEAIHVLILTLGRRQIDAELWDVMLRSLIEHSRFYPLIWNLDQSRRGQWMRLQEGIDNLIKAATDVIQTCNRMRVRSLNLTSAGVDTISAVRDALELVFVNAFPPVTLGACPEVPLSDERLNRAVEAISLLEARLTDIQKILQT